jgi:hypothetical protein
MIDPSFLPLYTMPVSHFAKCETETPLLGGSEHDFSERGPPFPAHVKIDDTYDIRDRRQDRDYT